MTYKAHSLKIHVDGGSAIIVPDITSKGLDQSPELMAEMTAAYSTPTHVAMVANKIASEVQSYAVATLLDALGVAGLCVTSATNPGAVIYLQKFDANGCPVSGSNHRSYTIKGGLIVPRTLSVSNRQDAQITCSTYVIKSGSNDPIVLADTAALPSLVVASARWTLGPITVGGVALADYTELEIDFGNEVQTDGVESNVYDDHVAQRTHAPTITIKGIAPTWFAAASIPIGGKAATQAGDAIYLRKRSQDDSHFVDDAAAEHIQFNFAGLAANTQMRAQAQRTSESSLTIKLVRDSSGNAPLVVDTTAALP
jgi:hypothetical protein